MHIGIIRERKTPPDSRVPLTPEHCSRILAAHPTWRISVEPSPNRCYKDEEYQSAGISLTKDLSNCDVLFGVKEVPKENLIEGKKYFFFSHTIKAQPYNRELLKTAIAKGIQLIDYECLTDDNGKRIIGFGKYAGIVGAHNGLLGYGHKTGKYNLSRACESHDFATLKKEYKKIDWPNFRTIITGGGRVAKGAIEVMKATGILEVSPEEYLGKTFDQPVWSNLRSNNMYVHKETKKYDRSYYEQPEDFVCNFQPYYSRTDLMINGIYWDPQGPAFFSKEEMQSEQFKISVIADVTCDIAPESSIPSTLFASTIKEPFFDYNPHSEKEEAPFQKSNVLMMSIDNLPNELPRDASAFFGDVLLEKILPQFLLSDSEVLNKASICRDNKLTEKYNYLCAYVS